MINHRSPKVDSAFLSLGAFVNVMLGRDGRRAWLPYSELYSCDNLLSSVRTVTYNQIGYLLTSLKLIKKNFIISGL